MFPSGNYIITFKIQIGFLKGLYKHLLDCERREPERENHKYKVYPKKSSTDPWDMYTDGKHKQSVNLKIDQYKFSLWRAEGKKKD